ncbi:ABC transporter permease [Bacteroidales bacterium OttesenSCG-928-B11]|nr:ABC transporter permease [Bacteroidales bacterium OttesenSCG-928-B11]
MSSLKLSLLLSNQLSRDKKHNYARPIITISVLGVALCLLVMLIALAVTNGYKNEIRDRVIVMGSHIRISNYDYNYSFEPIPFEKNQPFIPQLETNPEIVSLQYFATKIGIIKTDDQVEGIILKGIDQSFSWEHFQRNVVEGKPLVFEDSVTSNEVLLSKKMSQKLELRVGDKLRVYFAQDPPMQRSFTIAGLFETGLPEFDESYLIADLRHIRKINRWADDEVGGVEIIIADYDKIDKIGAEVNGMIGYQLKAETIKEIYPQIFEWIAMFDTNVIVLTIIIAIICVITMISAFLIVVLEQTSTIGILKTMGMKNNAIIQVFLMMAAKILLIGLLIGDTLAIILSYIQTHFHLFKLDPETYYVPYVPLEMSPWMFLITNFGILILCISVLAIPAYYISKKITPVNAIKME